MGGLRKFMPWTARTFIVAWLAIAGMVPLAGFWSKDEILASAWIRDDFALWAVGAVTALLTAFYMTRQVQMVFFGEPRWEGEREPHESPPTMVMPLVALAGLTVVGGLLNLPFKGLNFLTTWLEPVTEGVAEVHVDSFGLGFALSTVAVIIGVIGIGLAWRMYSTARDRDPVRERLGGVADFLEQGWRFDWLYETAIVKPGRRGLELGSKYFDLGIVDGAVNGVARALQLGGEETRKVQSGHLRRYAFAVFVGTALLMTFALVRAGV